MSALMNTTIREAFAEAMTVLLPKEETTEDLSESMVNVKVGKILS